MKKITEMKPFFLFSCLFLFAFQSSFAQSNYKLNINHLMNGNKLIFKQNNTSWEGVNYNVTRLQYYFSNFSFTTESNKKTARKDIVLLTNGSTDYYDLAQMSLDSKVKEIEFYFGLDSLTNHSDPSLYPVGSPLGFQDPEMNWGWSAGYRFLAVEGVFDYDKDGSPERGFEYHMVSDRYYSKLTLPVKEIEDSNGNKILSINCNVDKLFQTLKFSQKAILHGAGGPCDIISNNINTGLVFTPNLTIDNKEVDSKNIIEVKNNLTSGFIQVNYNFDQISSLQVFNLEGKMVASKYGLTNSGVADFQLDTNSSYVIVANVNGKIVATKRVVIAN